MRGGHVEMIGKTCTKWRTLEPTWTEDPIVIQVIQCYKATLQVDGPLEAVSLGFVVKDDTKYVPTFGRKMVVIIFLPRWQQHHGQGVHQQAQRHGGQAPGQGSVP